jgi:aromatic ring-opening dioxygenase catalytic subunit (LigB family)
MNMGDHLKIAEALSPLRHSNILIIGSGFATHSIGQRSEPEKWATDFKIWLNDVLTNKNYSPEERKARLLDYQSAPGITKAHRTLDHFLPVVMACAAAQYSPGTVLYSEFVRSLLNEHYRF